MVLKDTIAQKILEIWNQGSRLGTKDTQKSGIAGYGPTGVSGDQLRF